MVESRGTVPKGKIKRLFTSLSLSPCVCLTSFREGMGGN